MAQFAIGTGVEPNVWCEDLGTDEHGRQFSCLNGGWSGFIDKEGLLNVERTGKRHPATIIWEGECPLSGYNEAIPWIKAQILGTQSKLYGEPHPRAATWFWKETEGTAAGAIRGSTEMEALDRLREAYPDIGAMEWVKRISTEPRKVREEGGEVPF